MITPDDTCATCGVGFRLPSGKCDHCNSAAVNAYLPQDDDEPVTAEWLDAVMESWNVPYLKPRRFSADGNICSVAWMLGDVCVVIHGKRGELRAWHKAFGQELKEVGK